MQLTVITGVFAVMLYLASFGFQLAKFFNNRQTRKLVFSAGALAVVLHGISALGVIYSSSGYHFGIAEISTLFAVSVSLMVLISSIRKPLDNLFIGLFPLAIISIVASLTLTSTRPPTSLGTGLASHVLFSILAYSFITIAAAQAMLLAFQNFQLKRGYARGLVSNLPSLQDMEIFLFELLWVGQLLLSVGIMAGFLFVDDIWTRDGVIHKTFFSLMAWCVFAVLLWGRHQLGWRGVKAIRWTITGFALIILAYFGTKIALEYIFT
ncbi:MAG: cytochrome c biogenesis protein CcsA [Gammaproteobacteria bacterium]|nr:cytochrome c biogenesis protein CcsA [Gammaproteobacteria bacterium]MCY4356670.1 cytochrome c biogenesis protein CcsA [Gammaproteobacteria bacterium]